MEDIIKHENNLDMLLAPLFLHCDNADKKVINMFENHSIDCLTTIDPSFTLHT